MPAFDPASQPVVCADGTGPLPRLSFFDPGANAPQNLKLALGVDHRLPGGVLGTVDALYTRAVRQMYVSDANLGPPIEFARGEGNRPLYGTITAVGRATPARRDPNFDRVARVSNRSGDHALSVSIQLRRAFGDRVESSAFYAYTRSRDRMSVINPTAHRNLENTPLDGSLEARRLRTSYFEVPHRVQLGATARLPWRTWVSLSYAGASGTPYTHMVQGDANADGIGGVPLINDPVYVPRDSADIALAIPAQWDTLATLIEAEPCLRRQRGRILERNSCRNPWFGTISARVTKAFPAAFGHSLELTADVYNLLNLLNRRWGQYRRTIPDPWVQTLGLAGYDAATERGVYRYIFRGLRTVRDLESRWQVEVGLRYVF